MGRLPDPAVRLRWEERMRVFELSGLTVAQFSEQNGISPASFYVWRRKLRESAAVNGKARKRGPAATGSGIVDRTGAFVPVSIGAVRDCFRIRFSDRAVLEIPAGDLTTLLRVVEQLAAADSGKESPS